MTGRRADGYHHLDSLVAFTDFCDRIEISESDTYELHCPPSLLQDNLITKATHLMSSHFNIEPKVHIHLEKNIPVGAGLGGGSANAAATLLALRTFWNLNASQELLQKFASELGSDIVACLEGKPVIMRDTGNSLVTAPQFPTLFGVLVNPNTPCSTPLVYKTYVRTASPFSMNVAFPDSFETAHDICNFLNAKTRNDLTDAAIAVNPDVGQVLTALEKNKNGLMTRLSGSGSSCYTIFENEAIARESTLSMQKNYPAWTSTLVRIN